MKYDVETTATKLLESSHVSRRQFLKTSAGLGLSAAGMALLGACGSPATTPAPVETLETTTIRLIDGSALCNAPIYLAEDFLKADGFTDVHYVDVGTTRPAVDWLSSGEIDLGLQFSGPAITYIDVQKPVLVLAGVHVGCFELFGAENVHTILDLKGKTIGIKAYRATEQIFVTIMAAYVGLDPTKDINWVVLPEVESKQHFIDGKIDAYLAFPPDGQELRAKKIGQVVVNSMQDKPWSQYFCCMITGNHDFVQKNPVATKRAVRAILKATDMCALQPARAARLMVDKGITPNYDYALEAMQDIPYNRWREFDPDDALRFFALRLHEGGMVKGSPDEIIARGTDWRFLNEIKKEKFTSLEFIHQFQRAVTANVCQVTT